MQSKIVSVAHMRADHAAAQNLSVAPASMAAFRFCLIALVEQQLGNAFITTVGNGAA